MDRLQTYGIVPDEGKNASLVDVVRSLLGLAIEIPVLTNAIKPLSHMLRLSVADSGVPTGLLIAVSSNADLYFDMTSLFIVSEIMGAKGVTAAMADQFNLINQGSPATIQQAHLITVNVNEYTRLAYVLWTNDLRTFKARKRPIETDTINKMLRRTPSLTIEAYNKLLTKIIESSRVNDAIQFKRVQYMTFNETVTEHSFLTLFKHKLVAAVQEITAPVTSDDFIDGILDAIDDAKYNLGIDVSKLPAHCHIIYAHMASQIAWKLKKALLRDLDVETSVNDAVDGNDNVYTRMLASYYLHIA